MSPVLTFALLFVRSVLSLNYTYVVYDSVTGGLNKTLQSWSYGKINLQAPAPTGLPSRGQYAISIGADWSTGLMLHGSLVFEYGDIFELQFQVYGSGATKGPWLQLLQGDGSTPTGKNLILDPVPAGQWQTITVPFHMFFNGTDPVANQQLNGLKVVVPPNDGDSADASLLFADVALVAKVPSAKVASVVVDMTTPGRQVSPQLFGVNWGLSPFDEDWQQGRQGVWQKAYTSNRWGGNAVTRYAWDSDIQNRAADFFFEDIPNTVHNVSMLPFNSSSDRFIANTLSQHALPIITLPTIGWAPKPERTKRCGFSIKKYGPQQQHDQYTPDCGNGVQASGSHVTGNDPTDTSRRVGPDYAVAWLDHLAKVFGEKVVTDGMVYILDNEPNYWSATHLDVHPQALMYDELWNYTLVYGEALAKAHPGIKLMGPDIAGFPDLFTRTCGDDCKAHGSLTIIEWFIRQLGVYAKSNNGKHLLEYLDIHCYPEGDHFGTGDAADVTMRMRQTRELWDESFFAETWFTMPMGYLRRLQTLIDQYAPWLKISCTEFNYGDASDILDSVLTMDALAIYAREGVQLAARWSVPKQNTITEYAYALLNDYDQQGGSIAGLVYLNATSSEPLLGVHAFGDKDGIPKAVLLICRQYEGELDATVNFGSHATSVDIYRIDSSHTTRTKPQTLTLKEGRASVSMPAISAALLVVHAQEQVAYV